ncbi:hypothetical protein FSP39_008855 [Pinctada imbricata]|uniref:Uncharacterized protein n=1 Tax=Pinctada imbricata TaxID=66713 RepID=A0AA89C162_PINIB|nr:hypothetical protein FSP39_008855 [Pinctada imbricata]
MNYQKVYMNQIYSSSLMGQVAQMWRNQLLCDAVIKTGNITTKAHRLVMIAACPMLQHMENAAVGSHLEVRMSADIKQESVITFLQYLYEGFMKLTEDNCRDVEKIGKLLHVDSVVKCCADFYKCMSSKTGIHSYDGSKFDSHDNTDFKHVRFTDMEKTLQESALKRSADMPPSPGGKRQRVSHPPSPSMGHRSDDRYSMSHSYTSQDAFVGITRQSAGSQYQTQGPTGVIEIAEDGVEVVSSDPAVRDSEGWPKESDLPPIQHSMGISVTGQITKETDLQIVNVEQAMPQRRSNTNVPQPETGQRRSDSTSGSNLGQRHQRQNQYSQDNMYTGVQTRRGTNSESPHQSPSDVSAIQTFKPQYQSTPHNPKSVQSSPLKSTSVPHSKPFAAGSASQTMSHPSTHLQTSFVPEPISLSSLSNDQTTSFSSPGGQSATAVSGQSDHMRPGHDTGQIASESVERILAPDPGAGPSSVSSGKSETRDSDDMGADLTIVKIEEASDTGGLAMFVDMAEDKSSMPIEGEEGDHEGGGEDVELDDSADWSREEFSNEGSNINTDPGASWQGDGSFNKGPKKDQRKLQSPEDIVIVPTGWTSDAASSRKTDQVEVGKNAAVPESWHCRICLQKCLSEADLKKHYDETKNHGFVEICIVCGKGFKSAQGHTQHLRIQHKLDTAGLPTCAICGKCFPAQSNLIIHERSHSHIKMFPCPMCDRAYKHKRDLQQHMEFQCKKKPTKWK